MSLARKIVFVRWGLYTIYCGTKLHFAPYVDFLLKNNFTKSDSESTISACIGL